MCAYQEVQIRAHSMARSRALSMSVIANALAEHCRHEASHAKSGRRNERFEIALERGRDFLPKLM
jgi:hypothetical protein